MYPSSSVDFLAEASYWTLDYMGPDIFTFCGAFYIGGYKVFYYGVKGIREYNHLPAHTSIYYRFTVELHGTWNNLQAIQFKFEGQSSSETATYTNTHNNLHTLFKPNECGSGVSGINDLVIWGHVRHSGPTLKLTILYLDPTGAVGSFGFRDVRLTFSSTTAPSPPSLHWFSLTLWTANPIIMGNPCPWWTYLDGSGICRQCPGNCHTCFGPGNHECSSCGTGYYDGTACVTCHTSCLTCDGPGDNDCMTCLKPLYLINKSCVPCNPPLVRQELTNANAPGSHFGFCSSPCPANDYIYPDGACFSVCDPILVSVINSTGKFCVSPCAPGLIVFSSGSCLSPSLCIYPMDLVTYGSTKICEYNCPLGTIKFKSTNLCIPISECKTPYKVVLYSGFASCEQACPNSPPDFTYWNNSCNTFCPNGMETTTIDGFPICNPPLCGVVNCSQCTSNGVANVVCPDFYRCDEYLGRFCLPYYDYYLEPMIIKAIVNGHILQVKVSPSSNGLEPGVNDSLHFSIDNLVPDVDYSYEIKHISLGIFQVRYILLEIPNITAMNARFIYSPDNLNLQTNIEVPRVVFIDTGVKKAAQNTKGSSQLLFLLFILTIIGMIMGGGISALWAALPESQYSYYLIYLNVDYIYQTQLYMQSMSSYDLLVGTDSESEDHQMLDPILKQSLPNRFYVLGYAPDFITNADQVLIQIFLMVGGLILADFILKHFRFPRQFFFIHKCLDTLLRILKWNGLLRQGLTYTLALSTAAFVQIFSSTFGHESNLLPLISAVVTIFVLAWALVKMYSLIKHTPLDRHNRAIHSKKYGTLWEDLNISQTFSKYYYWLTAIRGFVLAYVCVFCDMSPYLQIFVVMFYQLGIVALFIKDYKSLRPVFCEPTLNKVMLIEESLLLLMKVFILAFVFIRSTASNGTLVILGWLIVLPGASIQGLQIGYSIFQQIKHRKKFFKMVKATFNSVKNKKIKKIRRVNRIIRYPVLEKIEHIQNNEDHEIK